MRLEGISRIDLQIRGLSKAFRGTWALRGVDLDVGSGETLVLFGRNGSGKTTLLKIVATVLKPTRGTGAVGGADLVRERDQVRRRIEFLAHGSYLYEDLTPRENLAFVAAIRGVRAEDGAVTAALERVGLASVGDEWVRTLSSGMKRRVSLARLFLAKADLWLLDEPYTNLDSEAVKVLEEALREHQERGGVTLMATHNFLEGFKLASRLAILARGRLTLDEPRDAMTLQSFQELYALRAAGGGG
ncbi:MAG: heme ABC exporter ATP-binding protein CcmA [Candidatus Methylomirabilales bacterium]